MLRDRSLKGTWLPAGLVLAALIGSAISQQRVGPSTANPAAVDHAESLSTAFRSAAHTVLPTVVKIRSRIKERRLTPGTRQENPFRGTPFEDFFNDPRFSVPFEQGIPEREGTGSGVIIGADGLILTNNHVVGEADEIIVELADGREFKAGDVRTDPQTDLAVIRIEGAGTLPAARLGNSEEVEIGDWVLAIGNPFELEASVSAGIISAKGRSLRAADRASFLQTDAAINPGNSGGPLVNLRGEVVGINTAIASSSGGYQGIGFAIPVDLAKWVIDQLVSTGSVSRAWLGVAISEVNQEVAEALGVDARTKGVIVQMVNDGSPAERAGVRPGDIITHFADQPVTQPSELQRAVERAPLSSKQKVRVVRRGKELELSVLTEALPNDISSRSGDRSGQDDFDGVTDSGLGVQVTELSPEVIDRLDLPADVTGVVVTRVEPNSIASEAGLRRGTVIMEVNGTAVKSVEDFERVTEDVDLDKGLTMSVRTPGVGTRFLILKQR